MFMVFNYATSAYINNTNHTLTKIKYDTYFNDEEEATNTVKDIIQKVKTKLSNPP